MNRLCSRYRAYVRLFCEGVATGNLPVPVGNLPTGMTKDELPSKCWFGQIARRDLPPGWQPGGTGRLPVPPKKCGVAEREKTAYRRVEPRNAAYF